MLLRWRNERRKVMAFSQFPNKNRKKALKDLTDVFSSKNIFGKENPAKENTQTAINEALETLISAKEEELDQAAEKLGISISKLKEILEK